MLLVINKRAEGEGMAGIQSCRTIGIPTFPAKLPQARSAECARTAFELHPTPTSTSGVSYGGFQDLVTGFSAQIYCFFTANLKSRISSGNSLPWRRALFSRITPVGTYLSILTTKNAVSSLDQEFSVGTLDCAGPALQCVLQGQVLCYLSLQFRMFEVDGYPPRQSFAEPQSSTDVLGSLNQSCDSRGGVKLVCSSKHFGHQLRVANHTRSVKITSAPFFLFMPHLPHSPVLSISLECLQSWSLGCS